MKTKLLFLLIYQISAIGLYAQKFESSADKELTRAVKVMASGKVENYYIKARELSKSKAEPTAVFEVTYTGFTDDAKAAFEKATEIWSYLISSPVPIKIDARWEQMSAGVLGSSGPPMVFRNFDNALFKDTWYHPTVANKLAGYDLSPESYDMITRYNSDYEWYLGTDGNCPYNKTDFVTIALHEIAHGLGFASWSYVSGIVGGFGIGGTDKTPAPFDYFMVNGDSEYLIELTNPSTDLKAEFTSNDLYFDSPLGNAANGDLPVELYAPAVWNDGSSISHLGESFNSTPNALMTYSAGTGEVIHDPGAVTMGILAEVGWISVRFELDYLKDIEVMNDPVTVEVEVYSDSAIYNDSVVLHYSIDDFATDYKVPMTTSNDTLYTADIPVVAADKVEYYIEAYTNLERSYYYPSQGVRNITTIDSVLYFNIATDEENPELIYAHETSFIFTDRETLDFTMEADDNVGIDSVYIEYKINDNPAKYLKIPFYSDNNFGLPIYKEEFSLVGETISDGDTIYYKVVAVDKAVSGNTTALPTDGYYKISVHEMLAAKADTIIDFDQTGQDGLFILNGMEITQPTGFNSVALHSPHPYEEGDPYPKDEIDYVATLKIPIIIDQTDSHIVFDEIVIVEPGETGTSYGDEEFWDYVILEGSVDSGKTWHAFEDGYDCTISTTFSNAYSTSANGNPDMYATHKISFTEGGNFSSDDKVLIRFRLWSDPLTVGWGWAIDNIKIQKDAEAPTAPGSLATTEVTDTTISLTWDASTDNVGVTGYFLYKDGNLLDEITNTQYKVTGLTNATSYSFYVTAGDAIGNISESSNTLNVTTTNVTGLDDIFISDIKKVKIYPNPAKDFLNVEYESERIIENAVISIYSLDGKLIYEQSENIGDKVLNKQINLQDIKEGIYLIKLSTNNEYLVNKLIIR